MCWDTQRKTFVDGRAAHGHYYSLQPIAHLELRGLKVDQDTDEISLVHVQATSEADGAIIALRAVAKDTDMR